MQSIHYKQGMITPALAENLIERSRSTTRGRLFSLRGAVLLLSGVLIGAMIAKPEWQEQIPQFFLVAPLGILILLAVQARYFTTRHSRSLAMLIEAQDAIQLEDWPAANEKITRLLSRPIDNPATRVQGLMTLAAVAEEQQAHESAQVIFEKILQDRPIDPMQERIATIGLAGAMLRNDQITDAVNLIDKIAKWEMPDSWRANVEFLQLFREVRMGQFDDAAESATPRRAMFRRFLSTRAGYGYGLLSLVFHRIGDPSNAADLWRDATMLIPPAKLTGKFTELSTCSESYPAVEWPL